MTPVNMKRLAANAPKLQLAAVSGAPSVNDRVFQIAVEVIGQGFQLISLG